jgi:hypothetical protein
MIACSIVSADDVGEYERASPARPATTGALADVPQKPPKPPPSNVVRSQPGAATETQLPRFDQE